MNAPKKRVYQSAAAKKLLVTTIHSGCKTPMLKVKFSTLTKPFYYPNSPHVPRYSVTCASDPQVDDQSEFIKFIQKVEKIEGVETIVKNESEKQDGQYVNTGRFLIKFQGKDKIPIMVIESPERENAPEEITLEDEFSPGEHVKVEFDIVRYTKKNNATNPEYGLNFKPVCIYFYPQSSVEA